jgi:hypothetical protein
LIRKAGSLLFSCRDGGGQKMQGGLFLLFSSLFWVHASASKFRAQEVISSFCSQNVKGMSGDNDNGSDDVEV